MASGHTAHELTVCVVARDESEPVKRLLDGLAEQSAPQGSFDLVVVDATHGGAFATLTPAGRHPLTVVRVDPDATRGALLNTAWQSATAPGVAFLAVDFVPAPMWVQALVEALHRGRRLVTGSLQPNPETLEAAGRLSYRLWAYDRELPLLSADQFACRRADLELVNGFDSDEHDPDRCDTDLAARLVDAGVDLHWARHAVAYHDVADVNLTTMVQGRRRAATALAVLGDRPRARARLLLGGVLWHRRNAEALLALAGIALTPRDRRALLLAVPWVHERTCLAPRTGGRRRKWFILPGVFAFDTYDAVTTTVERLRPTRPS